MQPKAAACKKQKERQQKRECMEKAVANNAQKQHNIVNIVSAKKNWHHSEQRAENVAQRVKTGKKA